MNHLIGSSNVYRFYKPEQFKERRVYNLIKCTRLESFLATLSEFEEGNVVISIFENLIVDAASKAPEEKAGEAWGKVLSDVLDAIKAEATSKPSSKWAVVMPIGRPAIKWYQDSLDHIKDHIKKELDKDNLINVTRIDAFPALSQQFENDGIHLTSTSGRAFLDLALGAAEDFFEADNVDLTTEPVHANVGAGGSGLEGAIRRIEKLESAMDERKESDNLMFARMREEIDSNMNRNKEDRIVINGICCKSPLPTDSKQKIMKLREIAMTIFEFLKPGFPCQIVFANPGRNNEHVLPMVEVKMETVEQANQLRKAYAEKRKAGDLKGDYERLFIANCVNLATRVRVDILKALAQKMTNEKEVAYVVGFISRPMFHIKPKGADQRPSRSFTFVDAMKQFGGWLEKKDLGQAYTRAGSAFVGQLSQNFVVLKDQDAISAVRSFDHVRGGARGGRGHDRGKRGGHYRGGHKSDGVKASAEQSTSRGTKRSGEDDIRNKPAKK
jgi:hypothetical protein